MRSKAEVNGQTIHYTDSGGDYPAVIFAHGFFLDHTMFDAQVEQLSDRFRCIAWDQRGFGETPVTGPFSYWDSAQDAVALLDHLQIDQAAFVGMSQGGFLSLRAALTCTERVRGVVLIGSEAGINTVEEKEGYRQVFDQWQSNGPLGDVGQFVGNLLFGDPALTEKWLPVWESRDRSSLIHPVETLLSRDDITSRLSDIACPVLVIHGTDDVAITIDKAEIVVAAVPDCRGLVPVRGAGHSPNMTHPAEVNSALVQFLDELAV